MRRSYLKGIIGALIGGLIATIPWILLYVYGNLMTSFLAFFVGLGALKGYQFRGITDRKLPMIITIVSLVTISIATLIIIPLILLVQESIGANITNLISLYSFSSFVSGIMRDYIVAILFTFIGLRSVMRKINA